MLNSQVVIMKGYYFMAYVRKRGNKWYYAFETAKINGKRHRIERIGGDSKKEAEEKPYVKR
ncbi:hypothetical protein PP40703_01015 [Pediococcus pentosaceus]|nr:hypothetical protein PP40703_01015 [Pediococcus pentosaceus]